MIKKRLKVWLQNISLVGLSFLMMTAIGEISIRFIAPQSDFFYKSSPTLGTELIANKKGFWRVEGEKKDIAINAFGFRGWDVPFEKKEGVIRIAALGDSYVEAFQVEEQEMFTHLLQKKLEEADPTHVYQVLAFGVSGYGTAQQALMYTEKVRAFDPDIVISMMTSGNDIRNNDFALEGVKQKAYFALNESGGLDYVPPEFDDWWLKTINRFLLDRSDLYRFLIDRTKFILSAPAIDEKTQDFPLDYSIFSCEYDENWNRAWDVTEALLLKLKRDVENDQHRFLLVNLTTYIQVHGEEGLLETIQRYPSMQPLCWDIEKPNKRLAAFSEQHGIDYLDLLPSFVQDHQSTLEESHLLQDGHWNKKGHQLAAQEIFKRLEAQKFAISAPKWHFLVAP